MATMWQTIELCVELPAEAEPGPTVPDTDGQLLSSE
jgi:hypothetical protein